MSNSYKNTIPDSNISHLISKCLAAIGESLVMDSVMINSVPFKENGLCCTRWIDDSTIVYALDLLTEYLIDSDVDYYTGDFRKEYSEIDFHNLSPAYIKEQIRVVFNEKWMYDILLNHYMPLPDDMPINIFMSSISSKEVIRRNLTLDRYDSDSSPRIVKCTSMPILGGGSEMFIDYKYDVRTSFGYNFAPSFSYMGDEIIIDDKNRTMRDRIDLQEYTPTIIKAKVRLDSSGNIELFSLLGIDSTFEYSWRN